MMHPLPSALRLSTPTPQSKHPRPPFGLRGWSTEGHATAVLLDARQGDLQSVSSVVAQVPRATTLPPRTPIVLLGNAVRATGVWRRLLGAGTVHVTRASRCTALVARGYVDVGGGIDEVTASDLAWGWSP
jgi:hypothetical protein